MFLENPLCKLLGIRYPIIQAGMAGQTTPELVAAVSNAGGLGILGATRMTPDKLLDAVRKIKMLTAKPYGVNLWRAICKEKEYVDGAAKNGENFSAETLFLVLHFEQQKKINEFIRKLR